MLSCRPGLSTEESIELSDRYCARAALAWERLSVFQLSGTVRLSGRDIDTRGNFVLWGDADNRRIRSDFYGPDGRPFLSLKADSTGVTVWLPGEEQAWHCDTGLPLGVGALRTEDCLAALRTGFPSNPQPWVMREGLRHDAGNSRLCYWAFTTAETTEDTLLVTMSHPALFPGLLSWPDGRVEIYMSTPGDEYEAWPAGWRLSMDDLEVEVEVTSVNSPEEDWPGLWGLVVPVSVDTLLPPPSTWHPAWSIPER